MTWTCGSGVGDTDDQDINRYEHVGTIAAAVLVSLLGRLDASALAAFAASPDGEMAFRGARLLASSYWSCTWRRSVAAKEEEHAVRLAQLLIGFPPQHPDDLRRAGEALATRGLVSCACEVRFGSTWFSQQAGQTLHTTCSHIFSADCAGAGHVCRSRGDPLADPKQKRSDFSPLYDGPRMLHAVAAALAAPPPQQQQPLLRQFAADAAPALLALLCTVGTDECSSLVESAPRLRAICVEALLFLAETVPQAVLPYVPVAAPPAC